MRKSISRRMATAGVIGAIGVGAALAAGGTAQAATPGHLTICTGKDFVVTVSIPGRGVRLTPAKIYNQVTCASFTVGGTGNERIDVYSGNRFLGSSIYNGTRGTEIHGIVGPSFYAV